jgi:predicted Zn-dependent peptidase
MAQRTTNTATLPNGLRIIHTPSPTSVVYCGYAVNVGTRDERSHEAGLAHFVEHMLFKGTAKRRAWHILNRMENVGGDLNAFTNKEETVVYSAFLKKDFVRALELLTDIVFRSTFPPHEVDKERGVILEEIDCYRDNPAELIFDDFESTLFAEHPLGHNILGDARSLRRCTTQSALDFTERFYHPANAVLFVYGNISFSRILLWAQRLTAEIPAGGDNDGRTPPPAYVPRSVTYTRRTHQNHVMIGCAGYPAADSRRTGLYMLNNMLGGPGMNSRLNLALREHSGLVYNVESNLASYTDTGVMSIYFGCDARDTDHCIELVHYELNRLCQAPLTTLQLAAAKKQLVGQVGVAADNFENTALGMAKTFLHYDSYEGPEALYRRIEAVTAKELWEISNELFHRENLTTLIYK